MDLGALLFDVPGDLRAVQGLELFKSPAGLEVLRDDGAASGGKNIAGLLGRCECRPRSSGIGGSSAGLGTVDVEGATPAKNVDAPPDSAARLASALGAEIVEERPR